MSLVTPKRTIAARGARQLVPGLVPEGDVLLVRSASAAWADDLTRAMGDRCITITASGEPKLPTLERLLADLKGQGIASVVAVGGGSAIDLAKALAALIPAPGAPLDHLEVVGLGNPLEAAPLPLIAVPTTAGTGAEATKNAVIDVPDHRRKVSLRDPRMVPRAAVLDPDLTDGLPWGITVTTGMDAITQLIEPFLSSRATAETDRLCRAAIGPAMRALVTLSRGEDRRARHALLVSAHLSGIALANAGLGAVHGLAGPAGGRTGIAHGAICARLLPGVLHANRAAGAAPERFSELDATISDAFGAVGTSNDLIERFIARQDTPALRMPPQLAEQAEDIAADAAASSSMKTNPVVLSRETLAGLLSGIV